MFLAVETGPAPEVSGAGHVGSGLAIPTSNRQDFDIAVTWGLAGHMVYTDWSVVRTTGGVATVTVGASDPSTYFSAYREGSSRCTDPTRGVEVDGMGRLDTGELYAFTAVMCDNGADGSGTDVFRLLVPAAAGYEGGGTAASGGISRVSGTSPAPAIDRIAGIGAIGPGTPTLGSEYQEFDFDVSSTPGGRLRYTDYSVVRNGIAGNMFVDNAADAATGWISFHQTSAACVRMVGRGRIDTNELWTFYIDACDNAITGSGGDTFYINLPDRRGTAVPYVKSGSLVGGDIVANGGPGPSVGSLSVATATTGSDLDPDGYTVTVDGGNAQSIPVNGSVTYVDLAAGSHSVVLSGIAANCAVSGGTTRIVTVPAGGTATASFDVTCGSPAVALVFKVQPSNSRARQTIEPPVQVKAIDAQGNIVTTFTGEVTVAIGRNGGLLAPGQLSGATTVNAVNGVAVFPTISIDQIGSGYTLVTSASGLSGSESRSFDIMP